MSILGPQCECVHDPCVCFVSEQKIFKAVRRRPRKTPLFETPPYGDLSTPPAPPQFKTATGTLAVLTAQSLKEILSDSGWKDPGGIIDTLLPTEVLTNCKQCGKSMYALKNDQMNYCSYECYASD